MARLDARIIGAVVVVAAIAVIGYILATGGEQAPATSPVSPTGTQPAATTPQQTAAPQETTPQQTQTMQQPAAGGLPEEIPIGLAIAVSKGYAVDGPRRLKGAMLAIEEMNQLLEKAGAPFRFKPVHEDTEASPQKAVEVIKRFAASGIQVVVGPLSTGETAAVMPIANQQHIVIISPSSTGAAAAAPNDYVFRMAPPDTKQGPALAEIIRKLGYEYLVIIARNDDYGRGLAELVKTTFEKLGGKVEMILYQYDKPDLTPEVTQLATKVQAIGEPDKTAVLIIAFDNDGQKILTAASKVPVLQQVRWFGPDSMARKTFLENKEIAEFLVKVKFLGTKPAIARNPVTEHFEKLYREKYGEDPTFYAYYAYDAAWIAMLSVLNAGKYDGKAIKEVLPTVAFHFMGATGHKVLDENGDAAIADYNLWTIVKTPQGTYEFKDVGIWYSSTKTIEWYEQPPQ